MKFIDSHFFVEMNKDSEGGIVDSTMHWINKIQNTTDVLAQFTGLIMMNAEAIYTSYSSFIGLLEVTRKKFLLLLLRLYYFFL